ncbi:MAG TPA: threonine/serine exporter family protein [Mycobacterium sp.]|nr:threonine/serine exporter family protein [Mycobacterium sp.]
MLTRLQRALISGREVVSEHNPTPLAPPDSYPASEIAALLREVGTALVEVVQPTQLVRDRLLRIAQRYTSAEVRVVVLPTVLVIQVGDKGYEVSASTRSTTQLDLADRVEHIARLADFGAITPADAVRALEEARAMPHRFRPLIRLIGYVITTVGFSMIINPTWASLWGHAFLGLIVGLIVLAAQPFPSLSAIVPTLAATAVTVLATWFVADAANDGLMRVIAPSLVALLPGLALTVASMELAGSAMIAGASRLVYGLVQLMLLVFGVAIGIAIAGKVAPQPPSPQTGPWAFYAAILVIGVGLYFYLSAPRGSLLWLTAAVAVALVGQRVGELFLSSAHAGALGAALVLPFTVLASRFRSAPSASMLTIAAFWALVPGALSFESMSEAATSGTTNLTALSSTIGAIFSIALGTLVSWSVLNAIWERAQRIQSMPRIPGDNRRT